MPLRTAWEVQCVLAHCLILRQSGIIISAINCAYCVIFVNRQQCNVRCCVVIAPRMSIKKSTLVCVTHPFLRVALDDPVRCRCRSRIAFAVRIVFAVVSGIYSYISKEPPASGNSQQFRCSCGYSRSGGVGAQQNHTQSI